MCVFFKNKRTEDEHVKRERKKWKEIEDYKMKEVTFPMKTVETNNFNERIINFATEAENNKSTHENEIETEHNLLFIHTLSQ